MSTFRGESSGHMVTRNRHITLSNQNHVKIDISKLNEVVTIRDKSILIESGCNMETLINVALQNGLIPKVLPELKEITVGGAIVGEHLQFLTHGDSETKFQRWGC